jgi:stress-induced morphogen
MMFMPMAAAEIERLIKNGIPDAKIEITDLAGDNNHFAAVVISSEFAGKSKLQQHQLVYKALGGNMGEALHALQLQTLAPK